MHRAGEPQPRHGPDGEPRHFVRCVREGDDPGSFGRRARRGRAARARRALRLAFQKTPRRRRGRRFVKHGRGLGPRVGGRGRVQSSIGLPPDPLRAGGDRRRHDPVRRRLPGPRRRARQSQAGETSRRVQQEGRARRRPESRGKGGRLLPPRGPLGRVAARRLRAAGRVGPRRVAHGPDAVRRAGAARRADERVARGRGRRARRGGRGIKGVRHGPRAPR